MSRSAYKNSIAIIGMNCTFPGALSPEELWTNVLTGRRYFRKMQPERLPRDSYFDPDPRAEGKTYCDQMAVIEGWNFDPLDYRIPPLTAYATDIAHWLALDTAHRALQDSSVSIDDLQKTRTGVVLGNSLGGEFARSHYLRFRWPYIERTLRTTMKAHEADDETIESVVATMKALHNAPLPPINEDSLAGNMSNTIAGRICNYFNFGAGGYTVDGACSSALLAIAKACDALNNDEMDVALAGGVDVSLDAFEIVGFSKTQALSADDIRPYDAHADGMITGEGCGFFLLMRYEDAVKNGAHIRAVIRGWGVSSDGAGGMTAPDPDGQMRALEKAYKKAGYSIDTVQLIEGHGTGTTLGDKVEITALRRMIEAIESPHTCHVGSIKANIGHCKAAAGAASLTKAVLSLERKILPPSHNCTTPHPLLCESNSRLRVLTQGVPWKKSRTPRRASVSAMGFGGANAHVTVEETQPKAEPKERDLELLRSPRATEVITLAADSIKDLQDQCAKILTVSKRICRAEMTDLAAELASNDSEGKLRIAIVAVSPWDVEEKCAKIIDSLKKNDDISACADVTAGVFAGTAKESPTVAFLFPGQGVQRLNMSEKYLRAFPSAENVWQESDKAVSRFLDSPIRETVMQNACIDEKTREDLSAYLGDTHVAQPGIIAASLSIANALKEYGITPSVILGHSLGEIAALSVAGACAPKEAIRIAAARGKAMAEMQSTEKSGMVAVRCTPEDANSLIDELHAQHGLTCYAANYNSPNQTVISGDLNALDVLTDLCQEKNIRTHQLAVSHGFHSPFVKEAEDLFAASIKNIKLAATSIPVVSSVTGAVLDEKTRLRSHLKKQITQSVRFVEALKTAKQHEPDMWIEVGPGSVLSGFVRATCGRNTLCMTTDAPGEDALNQLHRILAAAFVLGTPDIRKNLFTHRYAKPFSLDYAPKFIVNPCERPIDDVLQKIAPGTDTKSLHTTVPTANQSAVSTEEETATDDASQQSILSYAIDWISQRTGFPPTAIAPEMKLRDDLNLDSIKVGELVYTVSQKLNRQVPADPSAYANARLSKLLDVIQNEFRVRNADDVSQVKGITGSPPLPALAEWIRTFQVTHTHTPLSEEKFMRIPTHGSLCVIGDPNNPYVTACADHMQRHGLKTVIQNPESLNESEPPDNLTMLIYICPEITSPAYTCSDDEFQKRIETSAHRLFHIFTWAKKDFDPSWTNVRCIVARPYATEDTQSETIPAACNEDADAGHAFLRSLRLEHSAFHPKWLALPRSWSPAQWATLIEKEMQTGGRRVLYSYAPDGTRYSHAAFPVVCQPEQAIELSSEDVILCTGGARGITFEMARGLAKETGVALALVGRSPIPEDDTHEIAVNLRTLENDGIQAVYASCDVTDCDSLKNAVDSLSNKLGNITGILHGAGSTQPCLFDEMSEEQFDSVVRVKVHGLHNLLSVLPLENLKILHVVTSVLGHTGMSGQVDYTLANAWLDGAIKDIQNDFPHLHCLTLGYSIWSETGIGKRLGSVDSLHKSGTTPIDTEHGVGEYIAVCNRKTESTALVISGRLNNEIDPQFYPPLPPANKRFLSSILKYIPETECITEAVLDHSTDLYLAEHVYNGTPIMPGVMLLEAIVENAQYCLGRSDIPVFENINFSRAIIVPFDQRVTMRAMTYVLPDTSEDTRVHSAVFTDVDEYSAPYFTAEIVFDADNTPPEIAPPACNVSIEKDPEDFNPAPLFQGKFFRRIEDIHKIEFVTEVITTVRIPKNERYYSRGLPEATALPSPAARDAFLHTGILALPEGSLPASIKRMRIFSPVKPEAHVICIGHVEEDHGGNEFTSKLAVFDKATGSLCEIIEGVITRVPAAVKSDAIVQPEKPVALKNVAEEITALVPEIPLAFAAAQYDEINSAKELTDNDLSAAENISESRRQSYFAGLIAARRAAMKYAKRISCTLSPHAVSLSHADDGAPILNCDDPKAAAQFADARISLSDTNALVLALIAPPPVGIDIETIDSRDADTWRALLNDDGYAQALMHERHTHESFDTAATRIWALIESYKKAHTITRAVPRYDASRGGVWHSYTSMNHSGTRVENLSATVAVDAIPHAALAITVPCAHSTPSADSRAAQHEFDAILEKISQDLRVYATRFQHDPADPLTEEHHEEFLEWIKTVIRQLELIENAAEPAALYNMRQKLLERIPELLTDSEIVMHAIDKPYGYTGDFEMLEKLLQNTTNATGISYHMDRAQLEYPASQACHNRVNWVCDEAEKYIAENGLESFTVLDIGTGTAPVERTLLKRLPHIPLNVTAVDIEPAALAFVEQKLSDRVNSLSLQRVDIRRDDAAEEIARLAAPVNMCVAIGIFEALRDEELVQLITALRSAMKPGTLIMGEAFIPDHPTRTAMEWFMDYHLGYRTPEHVLELLERAGVDHAHLQKQEDPSETTVFYRIKV